MRLHRVSVGAASALVAATLTAPVAAADVTLTVSSWVPPSHAVTRSMVQWCDQVTAATSGRVKCNLLAKAVVPAPQTLDAVRDGLADVSFSTHGYTPGRYVLTQMAELPFAGTSSLASSVAYQRIYEKHLAKFDEHRGLKVITVFTHGPGMIFNAKRPIQRLADIEGLKFRVGGGMVNEVAKAIGMNATLKPAPQSYELLSSGVMDGTLFPAESVRAFKLDKLIKHATSLPGGLYNTSMVFVMNPAAWNRISKEDQAAIEKLSGEAAARLIGGNWSAEDVEGRKVMQQAGIQMIDADQALIDEVKQRTSGLEQAWIKAAKERGLANAEQVLAEFRAEIAKLQ